MVVLVLATLAAGLALASADAVRTWGALGLAAAAPVSSPRGWLGAAALPADRRPSDEVLHRLVDRGFGYIATCLRDGIPLDAELRAALPVGEGTSAEWTALRMLVTGREAEHVASVVLAGVARQAGIDGPKAFEMPAATALARWSQDEDFELSLDDEDHGRLLRECAIVRIRRGMHAMRLAAAPKEA